MLKHNPERKEPLDFPPFGKLVYKSGEREWFGKLDGISPTNSVEIAIEEQEIDEKIRKNWNGCANLLANWTPVQPHSSAR